MMISLNSNSQIKEQSYIFFIQPFNKLKIKCSPAIQLTQLKEFYEKMSTMMHFLLHHCRCFLYVMKHFLICDCCEKLYTRSMNYVHLLFIVHIFEMHFACKVTCQQDEFSKLGLSKVQRADLTCDVIRKVALFVLSKLLILVADWSMRWSHDTFLIKLRL